MVILFFGLPLAHADTQYTIPMKGGRWASYTITVRIPLEPKTSHDGVLDALQVWNQAQEWFQATYYPDGKVYTFKESSGGGQVRVQFEKTMKEAGLAQTTGNGNTYTSGRVQINIEFSKFRSYVSAVALHEFGHILGLAHATLGDDLMNVSFEYKLPSTLDLYAVHVLASGKTPASVTLPSNISYMTVPETAIPEFPTPVVLMVLLFGLLPIVLKRRFHGLVS